LIDLCSDKRGPILVGQLRLLQNGLTPTEGFGASSDDVFTQLDWCVVGNNLLGRRNLDAAELFDPAFPGLGRARNGLVHADDLDEKAVEGLVVDPLNLLLD
jgi:hypothetical protein